MFNEVPKSPKGCDDLRVVDCLSIVDFIAGDGHSIFRFDLMLEASCSPEWLLEKFAVEHESGDSYKSTIFYDGYAVKSLKGIYGLELIHEIASWVDVSSSAGGRGFRCHHLCQQLKELFNSVDPNMSMRSLSQTLQEAKGTVDV